MKLTSEQQDMLDGKYSEGAAYAMKIQVAIGECFDARRMVPITRAHVALSNQQADLWFCEKLVNAGARCRVTPTVNPGFCYDFFTKKNMVDEEFADLMQRTHNAYKKIGAELTYNCTPYIDTNVPMFGEITAYSESSATPFVNSVWGARSNREGANSALCAAITGFVPEYGLLLDENRKGNILVRVEADIKDDYDYHILGMLGKKIGEGIPVFTGLPRQTITREALRNLGAELNTSGAYGMYHIIGVTPEAPDMDTAFGGKAPEKEVVLTDQDMEEILHEISLEGNRPIDFVMFGCPHFTLEEVRHIAGKIEGKKLKKEMWILTSSLVKEMAERMGLDQTISEAGGCIVPDTCPDQPCWRHLKGKVGVTESPKCAYYPQRRGIHFVIRDLDECIEAALTGEVK
ncbi:aconitase X catalytic domain-containing protein [Hornefia butyriciproducens]|uniref:aconitase X catalytic domain-containing protein n=1 Tax=Hornefia butyriciproducens TaxID=2652293 RepID=UPI002A910707|nr:aconitase X catalytic domain-containing protein [Hornefia butyriciproducens]MCI7412746.1 aconitase X catalytic domain-containing protein [Clostridiales bacterium]MDY6211883.1 aconitase X catalytic domain-containing protein [Hornefia butyriciproducens]